MRMAVAFYVTGISTPEGHLESPPLLGTLTFGQLLDQMLTDERCNTDGRAAI